MRLPSIRRLLSRSVFRGYRRQPITHLLQYQVERWQGFKSPIDFVSALVDLPATQLRNWTCLVIANGFIYVNTKVTCVEKIDTPAVTRIAIHFEPMITTKEATIERLYIFDDQRRLVSLRGDCEFRLAADDTFVPSYVCNA